ncbi:uncharacterized protein BJ171DRAFT_248101 [Polychytrium aggregatum]|uniref:uncharacterized protein n=1 Tax=Polychytrium aggregatum TaxID=110093 RepID=UPI0022FE409D|nr:uncharacterized protein BJ171DRAFT_248101 [Polychytrium aggregatum]KAI9193678.1 hypothetical protein BJ171DRAFT_248101 [Polychytrium aggregatum]
MLFAKPCRPITGRVPRPRPSAGPGQALHLQRRSHRASISISEHPNPPRQSSILALTPFVKPATATTDYVVNRHETIRPASLSTHRIDSCRLADKDGIARAPLDTAPNPVLYADRAGYNISSQLSASQAVFSIDRSLYSMVPVHRISPALFNRRLETDRILDEPRPLKELIRMIQKQVDVTIDDIYAFYAALDHPKLATYSKFVRTVSSSLIADVLQLRSERLAITKISEKTGLSLQKVNLVIRVYELDGVDHAIPSSTSRRSKRTDRDLQNRISESNGASIPAAARDTLDAKSTAAESTISEKEPGLQSQAAEASGGSPVQVTESPEAESTPLAAVSTLNPNAQAKAKEKTGTVSSPFAFTASDNGAQSLKERKRPSKQQNSTPVVASTDPRLEANANLCSLESLAEIENDLLAKLGSTASLQISLEKPVPESVFTKRMAAVKAVEISSFLSQCGISIKNGSTKKQTVPLLYKVLCEAHQHRHRPLVLCSVDLGIINIAHSRFVLPPCHHPDQTPFLINWERIDPKFPEGMNPHEYFPGLWWAVDRILGQRMPDQILVERQSVRTLPSLRGGVVSMIVKLVQIESAILGILNERQRSHHMAACVEQSPKLVSSYFQLDTHNPRDPLDPDSTMGYSDRAVAMLSERDPSVDKKKSAVRLVRDWIGKKQIAVLGIPSISTGVPLEPELVHTPCMHELSSGPVSTAKPVRLGMPDGTAGKLMIERFNSEKKQDDLSDSLLMGVAFCDWRRRKLELADQFLL